MKKSSYSCFEEKNRRIINPIRTIPRWVRNIKHAYQRVRYGYCDQDVWSIDLWFLNIVPNMLEELMDISHGYPDEFDSNSHTIVDIETPNQTDDEGMIKWKGILSEMIFLLREANTDTCTRENKYAKEYQKARNEFERKYGFFGDGLKTNEEKAEEKKKGLKRMYTLSDVPEYKEIADLYISEEMKIDKYLNECKDKALDLFKMWFSNLWD